MALRREFKSVDAPFEAIGDPNRGLDVFAGDTYRGKKIFTLDKVIEQIDSGRAIVPTDGIITYGFFNGKHAVGLNNSPNFGEGKGYTPFSAIQQAATVKSVALWDDLVPQTFVNVGMVGVKGWAQNDATILLANTTTGPAQAWAYYPGYDHQYTRVSSDVFTATPDANGSNGWLKFGGYGVTTLVHELGHAIGLSHPGAYNFGPGFSVNYVNGAEYAQDSNEYSIMSYWSGRETGNLVTTWNVFLAGNNQTPMVHDILTIQAKYGADMSTRLGDTTYGFNSNAGREVFDFSKNPYPYLAVYDAGGLHDKIDASGFTVSQFIDLHAGSFSSIGGAPVSLAQVNADRAQWNIDSGAYGPFNQADPGTYYYLAPITQTNYNALTVSRPAAIELRIAATTGEAGLYATEFSNFAIAYGTTIEDATGGSARDVLWGNQVANILKGNDGNDTLKGFEGNDTLHGDAGADKLLGDAGNDTLFGGADNDTLNGGLGQDTLSGGSGNDLFVFTNAELGDLITDYNVGDKIDLNALYEGVMTFVGSNPLTALGDVNYVGGVLSANLTAAAGAEFSVILAGAPMLHADALVLNG